MTEVNRKLKSTITDITGKSWADLCDSSQSSQSQVDVNSPLKKNVIDTKGDDEIDLYDLAFESTKNKSVQNVPHDDLSLTSFMNNVHMVTPIKQEDDDFSSTLIIDEDTISSPFVKDNSNNVSNSKPEPPLINPKIELPSKDILHAKRRLTSECESTTSDPTIPEQINKVNKKSTEHTNIHDYGESPKRKLELETDPSILSRRQKQIDFGKNTIGYEKYIEKVPKNKRKKEHPKTPPRNLKYTRRAWDGLVKNWRVKLHCWDPDSKNDDDDSLTTCSSSNLYSLGSMTSLDSNSQPSDSRPSTPPSVKRSSEDFPQEKLGVTSFPDGKFKKSKRDNK